MQHNQGESLRLQTVSDRSEFTVLWNRHGRRTPLTSAVACTSERLGGMLVHWPIMSMQAWPTARSGGELLNLAVLITEF
jgi:hypothetical protein